MAAPMTIRIGGRSTGDSHASSPFRAIPKVIPSSISPCENDIYTVLFNIDDPEMLGIMEFWLAAVHLMLKNLSENIMSARQHLALENPYGSFILLSLIRKDTGFSIFFLGRNC